MYATLSEACPSCEQKTGRLERLIPVEPPTYYAVQRCDNCGHWWPSMITMESDRLPGRSYAAGAGDPPKF